ncbi:MAG TPA: hypothetical protein VM223_28995 [Planctomycetota bacterium]|nr:hypothetical protein [Planctomycetota bacterium]
MANDLMVLTPKEYPALDPGNPTMMALREMAGTNELGSRHMPRIVTPVGLKPNEWILPGGKIVAGFNAVMLYTGPKNVRWDPSKGLGEAPPLCTSPDGRTGFGDPGGDCKTCPFAKWGTLKADSNVKGCQFRRLCILLAEGVPLPILYSASPTSAPRILNYMATVVLYQNGPVPKVPPRYFQVVTHFGLSVVNGSRGPYGVVAPEYVATLDKATCELMHRQNEMLTGQFKEYQTQPEDVTEPETQEV